MGLGASSALWIASSPAVLPKRCGAMPGSVRSRDAFVLGERPAIVLLGDSLTQYGFGSGGWAARLAQRSRSCTDK